MRDLVAMLAFAFVWTLFFGRLGLNNFVIGLILGFLILSVLRRDVEHAFPKRAFGFARYLLRFVYELVLANLHMARLALWPRARLYPHVIAVPLELRGDAAITLLAVTITLLPGTVAMGVSADRRVLYAHAMGQRDLARVHEDIHLMQRLIRGFMG